MKHIRRVFDPFVALAIIVGLRGSALCQDDPGRGGISVTAHLPNGQPARVGIHVYRNGNEVGFDIGTDPGKGGTCSFANLVPGVYEVRVDRSERDGQRFAPQQLFGLTVSAGSHTEFSVALAAGQSLQSSGKIRTSDLGADPGRGRIDFISTDANALPIEVGVHIYRNGNEVGFGTGTDPNKGGLCSFANVVPGTYEIRIDRTDRDGLHFAPKQMYGVIVAAGSRTICRVPIVEGRQLISEGKVRASDLGADPGRGRIEFIATDSNHLPAGVGIHIYRNGNEVGFGTGSDTNKGGLCVFANVAPGTYEVRVDRSERDGVHYAPQQLFGITVTDGSCTRYPVTVTEGRALVMTDGIRSGDIGADAGRGRIDILTTDANHLPAGVGVHLFKNGNEVGFGSGSDTNKGGLCVFSNLIPGIYELHIDKSEHDGLHFAPLRTAPFEVAANSCTVVPINIVEGLDELAVTPAVRLITSSPNEASKECTFDAGADNSVEPVGDKEVADG